MKVNSRIVVPLPPLHCSYAFVIPYAIDTHLRRRPRHDSMPLCYASFPILLPTSSEHLLEANSGPRPAFVMPSGLTQPYGSSIGTFLDTPSPPLCLPWTVISSLANRLRSQRPCFACVLCFVVVVTTTVAASLYDDAVFSLDSESRTCSRYLVLS